MSGFEVYLWTRLDAVATAIEIIMAFTFVIGTVTTAFFYLRQI